jgi:hypothetical protein
MAPSLALNGTNKLADVPILNGGITFCAVPISKCLQGRGMLEKVGNAHLVDAAAH